MGFMKLYYNYTIYINGFDILQPSVHNDTPGARQDCGVTMPGRWILSLALLLLCVQSSLTSVLTAASSYEFTAYRMQQYHLGQQKHGRANCSEGPGWWMVSAPSDIQKLLLY